MTVVNLSVVYQKHNPSKRALDLFLLQMTTIINILQEIIFIKPFYMFGINAVPK